MTTIRRLRVEVVACWRWARQFWPWHKRVPAMWRCHWHGRHFLMGCGVRFKPWESYEYPPTFTTEQRRFGTITFTRGGLLRPDEPPYSTGTLADDPPRV